MVEGRFKRLFYHAGYPRYLSRGIRFAICGLLLPLFAYCEVIPGDSGDGVIFHDSGNIVSGGVALDAGHLGTNGTELVTAVYFFKLPHFASSSNVFNATLQFSFLDRMGTSTNLANLDVWGLGYVASPVINTGWVLAADSDSRTGTDLGTGIGSAPIVKISDNFLDINSTDPSVEPYRMTVAGAALREFVALLYDSGAVSGDYAVVRMNIDDPSTMTNEGYVLASANAASNALKPVLSINENTVLVFDPFEDGGQSDGTDPFDVEWLKVGSSITVTAKPGPAGLGAGDAIEIDTGNASDQLVGSFPPVTLANPGDFIQMTVPFDLFFASPSSDQFRMGIYGSGGSPITMDSDGIDMLQYNGYLVRLPIDGEGLTNIITVRSYQDRGVNGWFGGSGDDLIGFFNDPAATIRPNDPPDKLMMTLTRASSSQIVMRVELGSAVMNALDPGNDLDPEDADFVETFDSIAFGSGSFGSSIDFWVDEIRVETSVPIVQLVPHERVPSAVIEMEVETQSKTRYALQYAADPLDANWTDTGYRLDGDGDTLRLYGTSAIETSSVYRTEVLP